jgi:undecaprenyl pyrophosphate phosphatase UppP
MDIENLIQTVTNNSIYLSIAVVLSLIIAYSILKKLFKLLIIALSLLVLYVAFLGITNTSHEEAKKKGTDTFKEVIIKGKKVFEKTEDKENEEKNNK